MFPKEISMKFQVLAAAMACGLLCAGTALADKSPSWSVATGATANKNSNSSDNSKDASKKTSKTPAPPTNPSSQPPGGATPDNCSDRNSCGR
jgi:hypothetical protein